MKNNEELIAFERVGLTAFPTGTLPTASDAKVVISGNVSYTHGGGIMSNGFSYLGDYDEDVEDVERSAKLELLASKELVTPEGMHVDLGDYEFTFEVRDAETNELVATGKNDADGNITFDERLVFDSSNCTEDETTFVFIVTEVNTDNSEVQSSNACYRFTVTVKYSEEALLGVLSDDSILPADEADMDNLERFLVHQYKITEVTVEQWNEEIESWSTVSDARVEQDFDKSNTTRLTLTQDNATFTNIRKTGSLTIKKTVKGTGADLNKKFKFTITLDDESINGIFDGVEFVNGVAEVELADGEEITITGLPTGISYTVTEEKDADYTSTSTNAEGDITEDGSTVEFTNTLIPTGPGPEVGDNTHLFMYVILALLSVCGYVFMMSVQRKRQKR